MSYADDVIAEGLDCAKTLVDYVSGEVDNAGSGMFMLRPTVLNQLANLPILLVVKLVVLGAHKRASSTYSH